MRFLLRLECAIIRVLWMGLRAEARTLNQMEKISHRRRGRRACLRVEVLRDSEASFRPQDIGIRWLLQRFCLCGFFAFWWLCGKTNARGYWRRCSRKAAKTQRIRKEEVDPRSKKIWPSRRQQSEIRIPQSAIEMTRVQ